MSQPELFDVIELLVNPSTSGLQVGDRGAIVEQYSDRAYEVEFTNSSGETQALVVLSPEQFMVVWQRATSACSSVEIGVAEALVGGEEVTVERPDIVKDECENPSATPRCLTPHSKS